MKTIFFLFIFIFLSCIELDTQPKNQSNFSNPPKSQTISKKVSTLKIITWNLYNFGKSKDSQEIDFIAEILRNFHIVTIQEVSTTAPGARLADALNRKGAKWDYRVSDPTSGKGSERYAYLWQTAKAKLLGKPWLEQSLAYKIDREPFLARFTVADRKILLASFHAVPSSKKPADEIRLLPKIHRKYETDDVMIMGDFNLSQRKIAWDGLKALGYLPVIQNQKTSLKRKRKAGEHLAKEYDNIFFEKGFFKIIKAGVVDFSKQFRTLKQARKISDHLPIWVELTW